MQKAKSRLKPAKSRLRPIHKVALVSSSVVAGIWGYNLNYLFNAPKPPVQVVTVETVKTITLNPIADYIPSNNTIKLINSNPGLAGVINRKFGNEWRMYAELIARESSLQPGAINKTSGACGLPQALPCGKMNCSLNDVNCQLDWLNNYINNRYGNISNALAWHDAKGWY